MKKHCQVYYGHWRQTDLSQTAEMDNGDDGYITVAATLSVVKVKVPH